MAENINIPAMFEVLSRDPDFIKLDPSAQTKIMDKFFFDKNLFLKTLNERDPEFRQLDPNLQKQIADKIIEDYSYYYTKKKTEEEALERPFIDIPDATAIAATGGGYAAWKLGTKAGTKVGLELLGQVGKKAVTSGITGLVTEYPVGMAIEETTKRITESKLPDTVKMALNLTIPLAIGGASARFLDSRLERAIENSADKLAFNKLKKTMRKTLEDLGDITDATLQAENINDVISKTQELQNTIDSILKSKSVSSKFKQEIIALPDYAWRFVPEEWRRDLPVPSRAMPMGENVPEVNKVAREMLETKYPALPESPITKGEVLPEKTIIPTGETDIPRGKIEEETEKVFTKIEPEETAVKEPWQMTEEEFKANPPKGYKYIPNLPHEAMVDAKGNIVLGKKFFKLSEPERKSVIAHEMAHKSGIEEKALRDPEFWRMLQEEKMYGELHPETGEIIRGINGHYLPNENLVESYKLLFEDPEWLKKNYPKAYDYIVKLAIKKNIPIPENILKEYKNKGEAGIPKGKTEKETEETGVKEPWQMTEEEYADSVGATTPIDRSLARQEWEDKVWEAYKEGKFFLNTADDDVIRTIEKKEQEESFYDYEPESEYSYTQEYQPPEKEDFSHAYYQEGLEEVKKDMLDRYERVSKVLRDYGINSQDLNSHAGKTGLQMIRSKYGFRAVKKDGLPLDVIGQRIQEVAPELLPDNPDANDVYNLLEELPSKRDILSGNFDFMKGLKEPKKVVIPDLTQQIKSWRTTSKKYKTRTGEFTLYKVKSATKINKKEAMRLAYDAIGKETQENFIAIAVDQKNKPVKILHFTKGLRGETLADLVSIYGRLLSDKKIKGVYFYHNHPAGNLELSGEDERTFQYLYKLSKETGVKIKDFGVVTAEHAYSKELGKIPNKNFNKEPFVDTNIPLTTRKFIDYSTLGKVRSFSDVKDFIQKHNLKNHIIYLDNHLNIVGKEKIQPSPEGYRERTLLKQLLKGVEETGGHRIIFAEPEENVIPVIKKIKAIADNEFHFGLDVLDVFKGGDSFKATGKLEVGRLSYLTTELYSGINLLEGLKQLDQLGSDAIKKTVELIDKNPYLKKARLWLKSFYEPLPHLTEESREKFLNAYYGTLRPKEAVGGLQAKELSGTIKKILKDYSENEQTAIEVIIRYLEDPAFRKVAKNLDDFKEITSQLDEIAKTIDDYSEQLYQRGIITKSQREKWKGRYLTRLYMEDQALKGGVSSLSGITEQKIYKGRKIESIMDLAKKDREALGYIEDPVLSVKMNIAKNAHTLAADEFYKELINDPNFVLKDYVMDNPFAKLFPHQLPEKASPKYMLERVLPWVEDEVKGIDNPEILKLIEDTKERAKQLQEVLNDKRFEKSLPEDFMILRGEGTKYGVLTGLPVHKDVGLQVMGLWEMGNIPETALTKIDKVANAIYTWFKIAKVPFNLRAYPRNYVNNIFQFALENKGNPIPYLQEQAKTIKGIIEKDKYFQEALRNGLLDQNFAKKEIIDVLQSLKGTKSQRIAEVLSKLSLPYGWIDDFAKLNTYRIMRKRGMNPLQAVRRAQEIHYDYGLVPFWVRQIRRPSLTKGGIVGKLVMSPFVTFQSKAVGQLVRTFSQNPATVSALISSLFIAKYKIEKYYEEKYGKKYKEGEVFSPTYLRDPLIVHIMTKDGKHRYIDISQILPIGWLINSIGDLARGKPLSALGEFGLGSSPLNVYGEFKAGKDFFTGRPLYDSLDSELSMWGKGALHAGKKLLMPATVEQIQTWRRSRHPVFTRWITGTNIYDYTPAQLQAIAQYNLREINSDFKKEAASLKNKYARGIISEKDYVEGMKELLKKRKAAITKILNYKNLKEQ